MSAPRPLVTVLVPARNEAADIGRCLDRVAAQTYPLDRIEVLVVDGASTDGTASVAGEVLAPHPFARYDVVPNEAATTPSNLNAGLARAEGDLLCRVDARTLIEPHYVATCVEVLTERPEVAVVGGAQLAVARDRTVKAVGIARALNNRFAMGGSPYRSSTTSGPSDTVYLGAFRTGQLRQVGGWDERLLTNQDFDLNRRMAALGTVWFDARLRSGYVPRATYRELWSQYVRFGRWKVRYWRLTGDRPRRRQRALVLAGPVGLALVAGALASRRRGALVAATAGAALLVEGRGTQGPSAGTAARAAAVAAMACTSAGWVTGVWSALLDRQPS